MQTNTETANNNLCAFLVGLIRPGYRVTIQNRFGQARTGRAVMQGPAGWVLNMGGRYGTPAIANASNIVSVRRGK